MSHQFGFGWAKSDPNDLCLRDERYAGEFSHVKKAVSNPGAFVLPFAVDSDYENSLNSMSCFHFDGDFEQISIQTVSRFLQQYPGCTAFPCGGFPILCSNATSSMMSLAKNKLQLPLQKVASRDEICGSNECLHHLIMFSAFDRLLKQGFHAFATDDQLRGVVARPVDNNMMEVCALRNCVFNDSGEGQISIEVMQYKYSPLLVEETPLRPPAMPEDALLPVWHIVEFPTQCVFLPTNEEVQLLAVVTYEEARAGITNTVTSLDTTASTGAASSLKKKAFRNHASTTNNNNNNHAAPTHRAVYEAALLLTPLDRLNRTRGFGAYLPDTYSKARQYWELSYGINLPTVPDKVGFARILTSLGEVIVPQQALARGVAEVPWKHTTTTTTTTTTTSSSTSTSTSSDPQRSATHIHACLQHALPLAVSTLSAPLHPEVLTQQLRQVYMGPVEASAAVGAVSVRDGRGERNGANCENGDSNGDSCDRRPTVVPTKTVFVSALRMKEVAQQTSSSPPSRAVAAPLASPPPPPPPPLAARVTTNVPSTSLPSGFTSTAHVDKSRDSVPLNRAPPPSSHSDSGDDNDFFHDEDTLFGATATATAVAMKPPKGRPPPRTLPSPATGAGPGVAVSAQKKSTVAVEKKTLPVKRPLATASDGSDDGHSDTSGSDLFDSNLDSDSDSSALLTQDSTHPVAPAPPTPLPLPPPIKKVSRASAARAPPAKSSGKLAGNKK